MIGQEKIKNKLLSQSLDLFPKTILLLGEYGCGKKTLVTEIAYSHGLELINITDLIDADLINNIQMTSIPKMYLIDLTKLSDKEQNIILKFIEEPSNNSYVVLIGESRTSIIDTIFNRCICYEFEKYSDEELSTFIDSDEETKKIILSVCRTPGQIKESGPEKIKEMCSKCSDIVKRLGKVSYPNALSISKYINYKDEYDKYNIKTFLVLLSMAYYNDYIENNNYNSCILYEKVVEYINKLNDTRLNRKCIIEKCLTALWRLSVTNEN